MVFISIFMCNKMSKSDLSTKTILSIDVGMKNLGFCILMKDKTQDYIIKKWDVLNICDEKPNICCFQEKNGKTNGVCSKQGKFVKDTRVYCRKHAIEFAIPTPNINLKKIKKLKMNQLYDFADEYNIEYKRPILRKELLELIDTHIETSYYKAVVPIRADEINLIDIGRTMKKQFDEVFACDLMDITHVAIENQISPLASRMKTLQGMITQYFIMKTKTQIQFISSENKLRQFNIHTGTYNDRKKKGVEKTKELLSEDNNVQLSQWAEHFNKHKKKDDMADAFLQGVYFITQLE